MGEKQEQRGLHVTVFRSARGGDSTNGGITSKHRALTIVGTIDYRRGDQPVINELPEGSRVFAPTTEYPAAWLVVGHRGSRDRYVIPADETGQPDRGRWWMAGGNLVSSSDARWCELADRQDAVRVHDRHEG